MRHWNFKEFQVKEQWTPQKWDLEDDFSMFSFFRTWKLDEIGFWWFHVSFHPIFSADNV